MSDLFFSLVTLSDFDRIYKYVERFGEGSSQHSPVSMYSLSEKYADSICEKDGFLYTLRKELCDEEYMVYLAPMGDGDLRSAFNRIFDNAHGRGFKVKFFSITERYADVLDREFPGMFDIIEDRDLAEYMFLTEKMSTYSGRALKKRRSEYNTFWNIYGDRATVRRITPDDHRDIIEFENLWLHQNEETHDMKVLSREARMIHRQLELFDELGLSGVVARIDGRVRGFGYGAPISSRFYDAIIEKGDREVPHIYKVLRLESVKQCAMDYTYVNMEEDVGLEGLRNLKNSYKPDYLLRKYIAIER